MSANPPVSVCLTTYNRASVLPKTLDSLLAQDFGDFELIINDDCSSDATVEVCRQYEARDARVKYFRNPENLRMPGNLNAVIQRATGEFVSNVHDGDIYRPDLIEKQKAALDQVPTASFVFNDYESIGYDGVHRLHRFPYGSCIPGEKIALHFFSTLTSCVWGTVMARRSAYQRLGLFNPRYGFISDVDMWLRLARESDVAYVSEPLITLTPREPGHPYAFVHWQHVFWTLGIYVDHLELYRAKLPKVAHFRLAYLGCRRRLFLRNMLICIKYRRWDRVREGLSIWRDADDAVLKAWGYVLGESKGVPDWYNPSYHWDMARLRERRSET